LSKIKESRKKNRTNFKSQRENKEKTSETEKKGKKKKKPRVLKGTQGEGATEDDVQEELT